MGATRAGLVFLTLLTPGVLGEPEWDHGGRDVWDRDGLCAMMQKEAVKRDKVGQPCLLLARLGHLLVLKVFARCSGAGATSIAGCHDGMALCDLSSVSCGVTCRPVLPGPRAAGTQHVLSALGPTGLRALMLGIMRNLLVLSAVAYSARRGSFCTH